jgi:hypothetical protein
MPKQEEELSMKLDVDTSDFQLNQILTAQITLNEKIMYFSMLAAQFNIAI